MTAPVERSVVGRLRVWLAQRQEQQVDGTLVHAAIREIERLTAENIQHLEGYAKLTERVTAAEERAEVAERDLAMWVKLSQADTVKLDEMHGAALHAVLEVQRQRAERLERALRVELAELKRRNEGRTHYANCWKDHPMCDAMQRIDAALVRVTLTAEER